jgi:hypothetical protein
LLGSGFRKPGHHMIMAVRRRYNLVFLFLILQILLLQSTGCQKEYSDEFVAYNLQRDSIPAPVAAKDFPACTLCNETDELALSRWSFKTGNSFLCGKVVEAGIDAEKKACTFFGPSACSVDTGLVMTIYLPVTLDEDRFNITTTKVAFFYYDNHAPKDIFITRPGTIFSVTLQSFIYASGIAMGTFNGSVFKANGDMAFAGEGKFKVKLR